MQIIPADYDRLSGSSAYYAVARVKVEKVWEANDDQICDGYRPSPVYRMRRLHNRLQERKQPAARRCLVK